MARFDVLILGGGIVGCACACELAQAGLLVGLVERGAVGGGATAAGMGHVVVMDDSPAQLALSHFSRTLWQDLQPQLPRSVEYESRGTVWVAADAEEMQEVYAKQQLYGKNGVRSEVLDAQALAAAEPKLRPGLAGGLLVPEDGHEAVRIGDGSVMLRDGTIHHADRIVVATGADIALLPWLPIHKRKGHLLITDRYPGFVNHQLVELGYLKSAHKVSSDSVAFNVQPRSTGQLLIGSSRQYGAESAEIESGIFARMLDRAREYMPQIAGLSGIRAWTGFRAATPDKLPLIGPTEKATVFLAAGFEGLGITNAPGAARLLADQMLGRPSAIDYAPYLPARLTANAPVEALHA